MKVRGLYLLFGLALTMGLVACSGSEAPKEAAKAPAAAPAAVVDPATAGAVMGMVKMDGAAPKGRALKMDAEPSCAAKHSTRPVDETFVTGDGGALANVVVYVKDGLGNKTFPVSGETVSIDQSGCIYTPHVVAVQADQNVEIKNSDATTHNIHPTPTSNREWNESQPQGAPALKKTFAREELAIPVKCNVHPWMKMYIAVFKHPYFKVTGKDGKFEIKNLPPGDYTLSAWHEKLGESEPQKVTIGAKESKTVDFVFKAAAAGD